MPYELDRDAFREYCYRPGKMAIIEGLMGNGKTHMVISEVQQFMKTFKEQPVYMITNIPFAYRTGEGPHDFIKRYPSNVFGAETLEDFFRVVCRLMERHGFGECRIIWVLDEAQNFMPAERHMDQITTDIQTLIANFRKINISGQFITPLAKNLSPRIRGGPVEGTDGYCSVLWSKELGDILPYLKAHGIPRSFAKKFAAVRWKPDMKPWIVHIGSSSWTTPLKDLPVGGYAYDTGAVAQFRMGKDFELKDILKALGSEVSVNNHLALQAYFDAKDSGEDTNERTEDYVSIRNREQCQRVDRMRKMGIVWKDVGTVEGENYEAIRYRYDLWKRQEHPQKSETASNFVGCGNDVSTRARRDRETESETITKNVLCLLPVDHNIVDGEGGE